MTRQSIIYFVFHSYNSRLLYCGFDLGNTGTSMRQITGSYCTTSYSNVTLPNHPVHASRRNGLANGLMSNRRNQHMASHCSTCFQQAGIWTMGYRFVTLLYQSQNYFNTLLHHMDYNTMHSISLYMEIALGNVA